MACGVRHPPPAYLRAGIWPVTPFVHPNLIRFAEQLPLELRLGKKLYRDFLTRAGLPTLVTRPKRTEHFRDLMQHGLRHNGLRLAERLLADGMILGRHLVPMGKYLREEPWNFRAYRCQKQTIVWKLYLDEING